MAEQPLSDIELTRLRHDWQLADSAKGWLRGWLLPKVYAYRPHAGCLLTGLSIGAASVYSLAPTPQPVEKIVVQTEPVDHAKLVADVFKAFVTTKIPTKE